MATRRHRLGAVAAAASAALLLVLVLSVLAGCGGSGGDVDAKAVLLASSAKMKIIKGFHFVYEVHKPGSAKPGSGLEIARMTGDVNSEGNMKAIVDATMSGVPVSLGFVAYGDTYYIQDPLSQKWTSMAAADSPVGKLSLGAGTILILDRIADVKYEGEESKGGTTCHHISGMAAAEDAKAIAGLVDTTDPFPTDLWIGVADSMVYEVDIDGPATHNEVKVEGIWRSIVLSNLDTFVDIEAPQ